MLDVKTKQQDWVLLSINCCRLHLNNVTPQNEIKLFEKHIEVSGLLCCDVVSLSGSRLFEIMYYLQLQDSINNIIVNNWNLTSQHAIITYSSDHIQSQILVATQREHTGVLQEYLFFLCTCSFPWQDSGIFYKKLISYVNEFHDAKVAAICLRLRQSYFTVKYLALYVL